MRSGRTGRGSAPRRRRAAAPRANLAPQLEEPLLPAGAPVEHGEVDLMAALAERRLELAHEHAEVGVGRPRVHLRDERGCARAQVSGALHRVVDAPLLAEHAADLADRAERTRAPRASAAACSSVPRARLAHRGERRARRRRRRARRAPAACARSGAARPPGRADAARSARSPSSTNALTPTIGRRPDSTAAVHSNADGLDLALHPARLDRRDRAAELVDPLDQLERARLELVGERLDEVGAAERIGRVGRRRPRARAPAGCAARASPRARSAARAPRRTSSCAATARRRRPPRAPGSRRGRCSFSGCCAVSVEPPVWAWKRSASALRVRHPEPLGHHVRPEPPRRPELRHLLEEVVVRVEEEGEPLAELVGREPGGDRRLAVGDPVRDRERELLHRGRARLADVVPGDRDRVPATGSARRSRRRGRSSAASRAAAGRCSSRGRCTP